MQKNKPYKYALVMPPDFEERIKAVAERETRSVNGQLLMMIKEGLERREKGEQNVDDKT